MLRQVIQGLASLTQVDSGVGHQLEVAPSFTSSIDLWGKFNRHIDLTAQQLAWALLNSSEEFSIMFSWGGGVGPDWLLEGPQRFTGARGF